MKAKALAPLIEYLEKEMWKQTWLGKGINLVRCSMMPPTCP